MELSPEELIILVLIVFVCIVFLKAYAIGIVWRCYKYLVLRRETAGTIIPCNLHGAVRPGEEQRAYSTLLPNYDEATGSKMPPPSYQVAMANLQEQQHTIPPQHQMLECPLRARENVFAELTAERVFPHQHVVHVVQRPQHIREDLSENNNDTPNNNNTCHHNANSNDNVADNVSANELNILPGSVENNQQSPNDLPPSYNVVVGGVAAAATTTTNHSNSQNESQA